MLNSCWSLFPLDSTPSVSLTVNPAPITAISKHLIIFFQLPNSASYSITNLGVVTPLPNLLSISDHTTPKCSSPIHKCSSLQLNLIQGSPHYLLTVMTSQSIMNALLPFSTLLLTPILLRSEYLQLLSKLRCPPLYHRMFHLSRSEAPRAVDVCTPYLSDYKNIHSANYSHLNDSIVGWECC